MINIVILSADKSFVSHIAKLEKECFSAPWSENQISTEINKVNTVFLICLYNGEFAGYISGENIVGEMYVGNLAVSDNFRNEGVGFALMQALINEAKKQNCALLTLEVRSSNVAARKLYEKCQLKYVGERKNFYSHPTENACIYTINFD